MTFALSATTQRLIPWTRFEKYLTSHCRGLCLCSHNQPWLQFSGEIILSDSSEGGPPSNSVDAKLYPEKMFGTSLENVKRKALITCNVISHEMNELDFRLQNWVSQKWFNMTMPCSIASGKKVSDPRSWGWGKKGSGDWRRGRRKRR